MHERPARRRDDRAGRRFAQHPSSAAAEKNVEESIKFCFFCQEEEN